MLSPDPNLEFLRDKILHARNKSCCIETDSMLVETHIVETEKIDSDGNIYFFIPFPQARGIKISIANLVYHHDKPAYCVKIRAVVDSAPTILDITYSFGQQQMKYLKITAKILSAEYLS